MPQSTQLPMPQSTQQPTLLKQPTCTTAAAPTANGNHQEQTSAPMSITKEELALRVQKWDELSQPDHNSAQWQLDKLDLLQELTAPVVPSIEDALAISQIMGSF